MDADPASTQHPRGFHTRWKAGQSGNPEGRRVEQRALALPETHESVAERRLTAILAKVVDPEELALMMWAECRGDPEKGIPRSLPAMKYVYDRIEGLPVQRHEAKLAYQVDETARILAEKSGLPVEEIVARAKAIAAGT